MRSNAVDKGRTFNATLLLETKDRAMAVLLKGAECGFDVKLVTRRNANARHVHDQALAHMLAQGFFFWMRMDNHLRQLLRNGHAGF
jgi:hypothetical protein